jgi:hypothetical protein
VLTQKDARQNKVPKINQIAARRTRPIEPLFTPIAAVGSWKQMTGLYPGQISYHFMPGTAIRQEIMRARNCCQTGKGWRSGLTGK